MSNKKKNMGLVNEKSLDFWLSSTGHLFPRNEVELDVFEKLYENYESRIEGVVIDANAIINNEIKLKNTNPVTDIGVQYQEIRDLKMVARKGDEIPDEILRKIRNKHK